MTDPKLIAEARGLIDARAAKSGLVVWDECEGLYNLAAGVVAQALQRAQDAEREWQERNDTVTNLVAEAVEKSFQAERLAAALEPYVDIKAQNGAWGVISTKLDGLAPMTVTVTKAQMLNACTTLNDYRGRKA